MKRREFVAAGVAALGGCVLPYRRVFGAEPAAALPIVGLDGRQLSLSAADLQDLRASLRGELITASSPDYDSARRLWIPTFDRRPSLIVRCAGAGDVKRAVSFAAAHGLLTAVRGGGHSLSGQSGVDNGMVIDVSPMRMVEVDPVARRARVAAGSLLGELDLEAAEFGLATTAGTVADTGVAGLTLGGGIGRLARKHSLSCDNVTAFELVTADGRWQRASASENPDLYWALRGGGGNFGVVTSFEFQLHELAPVIYGGTITYPFDDARGLLRSYMELCAHAPDELDVDVDLQAADDGGREVQFSVCYCGPAADAERVVAPLRKLGKATADKLGPVSYLKLQGSANMPGHSNAGLYIKGGLLSALTPALIDAMLDYIDHNPSPSFDLGIEHMGGAISRVAPDATAYFNRHATHNLLALGYWRIPADGPEAAERNATWVRGAWKQLEPFTQGHYVNIMTSDATEGRAHSAYGDNFPRLAALKKRYDPNNLFRLNANIKPA
ncbi:MAG TPA: FAD-binding oxidoreductase [Steroidobacteraceae bacterium]|jgi:FAD/FMN-containing dehydrogenase